MRSLPLRIGPATAATTVALLLGAACGSRSELSSAIDGIASSGSDGGSTFDGGTTRDGGRDAGASDGGSTCLVCSSGQTRCEGGELETCAADGTGCGEWDNGKPCSNGDVCAGSAGSASCRGLDVETPRLLAPLSTATVTSHRPRLSWILAGQDDGAEVDICTDRACAKILTTFSAVGTSGMPSVSLAAGVYFWRARGSEAGIVGADTSAVWQLIVPARDAPTNTAWGSTFDGNGDGFADVVVGVQDTDQLAIGSSGAAYFFAGGPSGVGATPTSTLFNPSTALGTYVASAGDVNGDGFADLAVGCPDANGSEGEGLLSIYLGSAGGPVVPGAVFRAAPHEFEYGGWISNAGDINGDGYGDVLVSKIVGASRVVQIFLGGPTGLAPSSKLLPGGALVALTAASDVNADGFTDVLVARWGEENSHAGAVDEYLGGPSGLPSSPSATFPFTGNVENFFVVNLAEVGDVNGDGYGDVIAGNSNIGTLTVLLGSPSGLVASTTLHNPGSQRDFGIRLAGGGDIDHDGFDDVIVGAPGYPSPVVYVYFGGSSGLATSPLILSPPPDGALGSFGDPVGGAGDVDGDGFDDLVIGGLGSPGAAWFYRGAKNRSLSPSVTFTGPANDFDFSDSLL